MSKKIEIDFTIYEDGQIKDHSHFDGEGAIILTTSDLDPDHSVGSTLICATMQQIVEMLARNETLSTAAKLTTLLKRLKDAVEEPDPEDELAEILKGAL